MLELKWLVILLGLPGMLAGGARFKRNDMRCMCVPYFQCGEDGRLDLYGSAGINERFGFDDSSGNRTYAILTGPNPVCTSAIDICCELPDEDEEEDKESSDVQPHHPVTPSNSYAQHPTAGPVTPPIKPYKPLPPPAFNPHLIPSPIPNVPKTPDYQNPSFYPKPSDGSGKPIQYNQNPTYDYADKPVHYSPNPTSDYGVKPVPYNPNPTPDYGVKPEPYNPYPTPDYGVKPNPYNPKPTSDYGVKPVPYNPNPAHNYPHPDNEQSSEKEEISHLIEPVVPNLKGCGLKRLSPFSARLSSDRITGINDKPENTFYGEYPWMIAVFRESHGEKIFTCGGSLIEFDVVLTAAHCVHKLKAHEIHVRAGEWDSRILHKPLPHQNRQVRHVSIHEHFDSRNLRNDIALLFLSDPFHPSKTVDTICVPEEHSFEPIHCQATGWGINSFNERGIFQPILKKVELPLIDRDTCQKNLRETRLGHFFRLHKSFICAGGQVSQDTCTGDGGGPLVCDNFDGSGYRFAQVGIVSWGIECGHDTPGVYVSVSHFYDWIHSQILYNQPSTQKTKHHSYL